MIYFIIVLILFTGLAYFIYKQHQQIKKIDAKYEKKYRYYDLRMLEMEKYGYTDIRELNDYLKRVDKYLNERGVTNE